MIDFRDFRDGRNKRLNLKPSKIIVPPNLEWDAREILKSQLRSDTANNATNAFAGDEMNTAGLQIVVWDYLTDTDAWFLQAPEDDHYLIFLEREAFNTVSDVNSRNRALEVSAWGRFDVDWVNNGIGVFGSPGA